MKLQQIYERLQQKFPDGQIKVIDLTGTSDHWEVSISSQSFVDKSRIQQHQMVMACFEMELKTGDIHALSIKTSIPKV